MKNRALASAFLPTVLLVLILSLSAPAPALAKSRTVRVGWFEQPGYQETLSDGSLYGYSYEYLLNLAQTANWGLTFVSGSTVELLDKLAAAKLILWVPCSPRMKGQPTINARRWSRAMPPAACSF